MRMVTINKLIKHYGGQRNLESLCGLPQCNISHMLNGTLLTVYNIKRIVGDESVVTFLEVMKETYCAWKLVNNKTVGLQELSSVLGLSTEETAENIEAFIDEYGLKVNVDFMREDKYNFLTKKNAGLLLLLNNKDIPQGFYKRVY